MTVYLKNCNFIKSNFIAPIFFGCRFESCKFDSLFSDTAYMDDTTPTNFLALKKVSKMELRYSLRTAYLGLAKSRAQVLAGLFQWLFRKQRESEMGSNFCR